jgi:uncharacterized protein (DUF2062 family)
MNAPVPSRLTVPRKFFRKYQHKLDAFRSHPLVVRYGAWLQPPALWCFSRRSVSGALAIGLFAGLVPGPFQMLVALAIAVPLRKNIPVALVVTLYTNPFTIVPLYVLAYTYGHYLLGLGAPTVHIDPLHMPWTEILALGKPLALGLLALALTLAALGYAIVEIAWRIYVVRKWQRRHKRA